MALVDIESWDYLATADLDEAGWTNASNAAISAGNGRFGDDSLRTTQSGSIGKTYASLTTGVIGFAFRTSAIPTNGTLLTLLDGATGHVDLRIVTGSVLRVTRAGTTLGTGTTVLLENQYYYFEFKVTIDDSTGVAQVKINGVDEINLTNQDTRNGATAVFNVVRLETNGFASGTQNDFTDYYLDDSVFNGDLRIQSRMPNGNGNYSQLVGSDGNSTDNYLLVDEADPNGDTDYVESSTAGDKDTYTYENITPTTGSIVGVKINTYARKTDAGARTIRTLTRLSATDEEGPDRTLASTFAYHSDIRTTKPGGGSFSITDVNNLEVGVKVQT